MCLSVFLCICVCVYADANRIVDILGNHKQHWQLSSPLVSHLFSALAKPWALPAGSVAIPSRPVCNPTFGGSAAAVSQLPLSAANPGARGARPAFDQPEFRAHAAVAERQHRRARRGVPSQQPRQSHESGHQLIGHQCDRVSLPQHQCVAVFHRIWPAERARHLKRHVLPPDSLFFRPVAVAPGAAPRRASRVCTRPHRPCHLIQSSLRDLQRRGPHSRSRICLSRPGCWPSKLHLVCAER